MRSLPSNSLCGNGCAWLHAHVVRDVVGVGLKPGGHSIHHQWAESLRLGNGTILVSEQQGFQVDNFFTELGHCGSESIILGSEQLNLGLKVGQPLLLALSTFERRNPVDQLVSARYRSSNGRVL